ncbi:hypothetical protein [Streptomyces lavendulae]|uniref:hypothetical protein n=1 Tax=Streptomyces lavendulae TaxID=1914 RepID=UPI0036E39D37
MTRSHIPLTSTLLACLALSACAADKEPQGGPPAAAGAPSAKGSAAVQPFKDDTDVPLTKQLGQSELTQAIPDAPDVVPGYYRGSSHKSQPGKADDCAPLNGPAPSGWQRAARGEYDFQGSTLSRGIRVNVCQFDNAQNAKAAYGLWPDKDEVTEVKGSGQVGEESIFLAHSGSGGSVAGYSRSGTVVVQIHVEDAGGDPKDAHDVLAATIKRLQQVQAGRRATATATEIAELERAR